MKGEGEGVEERAKGRDRERLLIERKKKATNAQDRFMRN